MAEACVKIENAVKEFPSGSGAVRALDGLSLEIFPGEILAVTGESGCGKSTLLNIIGFMDELTAGCLSAFGRDMTRLSEKERTLYRRRDVGFIFQDYHLMSELTALENVAFIASLAEDPLSPAEMLRAVGLEAEADRFPGQLSGGQQQRVAVARALVKRPKLLLADEPTAALDLDSARDVLTALERAIRSGGEGTALVLVTHNREITKLADRVALMKSGRIVDIVRQTAPRSADAIEW
ncbi:MAG: ABC transporter ATP-binding protein [Ruminococcaceae bacterium]|nr:ABC transporter ATP-binding protein [Oscillospiraceae bacterium]